MAESLEAIAVGRYLDDMEWEEAERREGRNVAIPEFPYFWGKERNEPAKSSSWFSGWKLIGGSSAP